MGNEELRTLVSEARRLRAQENWGEAAIEANTRILVLDPANVAALNRRARCYRERMDLSAAKEDYLHALELSPGNENIEKVLLEIEETFREGRNYEKRVDEIRSIRDSAEACAIGREYKNKSPARRRIAVEAFRQAFMLDRNKTDVLIELAAIHRSLRQRAEAERIYDWILRRERNSAAKVGLAALYKDKKRLRDGLKLCDEVLADEPRNPYALRCRAGILSELDRGAEAADSFGKSFDQW
jgi:tetratricopeptide (TPR) repeat protein